MARPDKDEECIHMEIIVDAYGPEEQAMGWYNYLSETLQFPFTAQCVARRAISLLEPGDEAEVVGIAPAEECEHNMFMFIWWKPRQLTVPLSLTVSLKHIWRVFVLAQELLCDSCEKFAPIFF